MTTSERDPRAPREQTAQDRTSAPEVGEPQTGEPGVGATAIERSTESWHDDSSEFEGGHIVEDGPVPGGPGGP